MGSDGEMDVTLRTLAATLLALGAGAVVPWGPAGESMPGPQVVPAAVAALPETTTQAVRAVRWTKRCVELHCARVEAWERGADGRWVQVRVRGAKQTQAAAGPNGFAPPGQKREGDGRTPTGTYRVLTTFSVGGNPGTRMPWRERTEESVVVSWRGPDHNTWVEVPGRRGGTRSTMRHGLWLDHNHGRLTPGVGPAPEYGKGSGIFLHATDPREGYAPSEGCIALAVEDMEWILTWLDPDQEPRVVLGR